MVCVTTDHFTTNQMSSESILHKRQSVATILIAARLSKGLSQSQLGDLVGFAANTIARIENCRFSPNADQLYALCEALDIKLTLDGKEI
jgi:transcriptional regulator with XRE-family HTH domain